ncbi:glycosyltransferase family 4 protein [Terrimonas pollutisoli]|uniref:glycosyltransferase family 4 protein n=1 Tax=Terrimonas pollutisoli TaxID=3034147 RepID=UPI0023ED8598|nr:glycosyltransferase [Terrimonas sp. H1YJ31]
MAGNKNTLVILTPGFAESEADSVCLPMQQQLVKTLKENNPEISVKILSFQYPYHTYNYSWFGIEVIPFSGRNKGGISRLLLRKKIISSLDNIHRTSAISGLLSFWYGECAAVGHQFAAKHGLQHFCWILGQDARKENDYPKKIKLPASTLVALSDFLQDEFEKNHGLRPGFVVPPGMQIKRLLKPGLKKDIDLLAVGSLIPLKQYEIFIEVVAETKKHYPAVKAALIGKGPEIQRLQSLTVQSGLENNIVFPGELSHDETLLWMQKAKILLHPSSYEGFSGVCMEALSEAAHVISFCKAMREEIEHWHIVQSKEEMKQKALEILQNPVIEYKRISNFKVEDTAKKIMELFSL